VIKGTALPPDEEEWRRRMQALSGMTNRTIGNTMPAGIGAGVKQPPVYVPSMFGGPGVIGGTRTRRESCPGPS